MDIQKYLEQDINNPTFLFHGSPKRLEVVCPRKSHDSRNNASNIANAIFLFPSFLKSTPYAFMGTIIEKSEGLDWSFDIPNTDTYPLMTMENVIVDDDIVGYIHVFKKSDKTKKDPSTLQYKCFEEMEPIDVIRVRYGDFKEYYVIKEKEDEPKSKEAKL